jgi:hypothetical protein
MAYSNKTRTEKHKIRKCTKRDGAESRYTAAYNTQLKIMNNKNNNNNKSHAWHLFKSRRGHHFVVAVGELPLL